MISESLSVFKCIQVTVMSAGLANILQHSPQGVGSGGVGVACMGGVGGACSGSIGSSPRKWKVGDLEFEALMRMLDNQVSIIKKFILVNKFDSNE